MFIYHKRSVALVGAIWMYCLIYLSCPDCIQVCGQFHYAFNIYEYITTLIIIPFDSIAFPKSYSGFYESDTEVILHSYSIYPYSKYAALVFNNWKNFFPSLC